MTIEQTFQQIIDEAKLISDLNTRVKHYETKIGEIQKFINNLKEIITPINKLHDPIPQNIVQLRELEAKMFYVPKKDADPNLELTKQIINSILHLKGDLKKFVDVKFDLNNFNFENIKIELSELQTKTETLLLDTYERILPIMDAYYQISYKSKLNDITFYHFSYKSDIRLRNRKPYVYDNDSEINTNKINALKNLPKIYECDPDQGDFIINVTYLSEKLLEQVCKILNEHPYDIIKNNAEYSIGMHFNCDDDDGADSNWIIIEALLKENGYVEVP